MNTNHPATDKRPRRVVTWVLFRSQPNGDVWPPPHPADVLIDWRLPAATTGRT